MSTTLDEDTSRIATDHHPLHELTPQQASLEEAFMTLTRDDIEYKALPSVPEKEEAAA